MVTTLTGVVSTISRSVSDTVATEELLTRTVSAGSSLQNSNSSAWDHGGSLSRTSSRRTGAHDVINVSPFFDYWHGQLPPNQLPAF